MSGVCLVTGSEGAIGKFLCELLTQRNIPFITLDRVRSVRKNHIAVDLISSDLSSLLADYDIDSVIHLAAQTDVMASIHNPTNDLHSNGLGTLNLMMTSSSIGVKKIVYINSGGAIYSPTNDTPFDEDSVVRPSSPYGLSKQLGEDYVRILSGYYSISWVSLALSNVYGPAEFFKKGLISTVLNAAQIKSRLNIYGPDVTRDYIHVQDVAEAIVLALSTTTSGRYNIGSGVETTNLQIVKILQGLLNTEIDIDIFPPRVGEILSSSLNNMKARKELNWSPEISMQHGLELCARDFSS